MATLDINQLPIGTGIDQIPVLEDVGGGTPGLPPVDGSQLTGITAVPADLNKVITALVTGVINDRAQEMPMVVIDNAGNLVTRL